MYLFKRGLFLLLSVVVGTSYAHAQSEEILDYRVDIAIEKNSDLRITEEITVYATGDQIKRGIFRDFPTDYTDRFGNSVVVDFEVLSVSRDGVLEPFRIERFGNGYRVYIGDKDVFLAQRSYRYTIEYRTSNQLGFFKDSDELYYNAIGTGWVFPIRRANITVRLPELVPADKLSALDFSGPPGATSSWCDTARFDGGVRFATNRILGAHEGVTVVVTFPKGVVTEPTPFETIMLRLAQNIDLLVALIGAVWLWILGYFLWITYGKDPARGVVVPLFEAPLGISPAGCSYLKRLGYTNEALTATLISLASKGHLEINQTSTSEFEVVKKPTVANPALLAKEESAVIDVFLSSGQSIRFEKEKYQEVQRVIKACRSSLDEQFEERLVKKNKAIKASFFGAQILIYLLVFALMQYRHREPNLLIIGLGVVGLIGLWIFNRYISAPTGKGRAILDKIEGFEMYLSTAEEDTLKSLSPPEMTKELFERFFPYALALGCAQLWSEKLNQSLIRAGQSPSNYHPAWYHSSLGNSNLSTLGSNLGSSLASSIASSSSPPGSSSGSGGSSGGGGGGGGGGGW